LENLGLGNEYAVKTKKYFDRILKLYEQSPGALIHKVMIKCCALVEKQNFIKS